MTFPIPYIPPLDSFGEWELFSNTTTNSYPAGLQDGDIAIISEAFSRTVSQSGRDNVPPVPGIPAMPIDATELDSITSTTTFTIGGGKDLIVNFAARGLSRVSFRALNQTDSESSVVPSTTSMNIRVLIFRCTVPASLPSAQKIGSNGTAASFSSTVDFVTPGHLPPLPAIYTLRIRNNANIGSWDTTFDGVTQTQESALASARFRVATVISFRLDDDNLDTVNMVVGSTSANLHLHQPFTLKKD